MALANTCLPLVSSLYKREGPDILPPGVLGAIVLSPPHLSKIHCVKKGILDPVRRWRGRKNESERGRRELCSSSLVHESSLSYLSRGKKVARAKKTERFRKSAGTRNVPTSPYPHHCLSLFIPSQNKPLEQKSGVIITNQSLVLQKIDRKLSGSFTCQGVNAIGKGSSQEVFLDVKCEYLEGKFAIKDGPSRPREGQRPLERREKRGDGDGAARRTVEIPLSICGL